MKDCHNSKQMYICVLVRLCMNLELLVKDMCSMINDSCINCASEYFDLICLQYTKIFDFFLVYALYLDY